MISKHWRKLLGITGGVVVCRYWVSLSKNEYDVNSIGVVRLCRAFYTAGKIARHYHVKLYSSVIDPNSPHYQELKSQVHHEAAEMLLSLCCVNKGVYIKVGQHIASLDYLVPPEYIKVMKVLHADAPKSSLKNIYKVLREDLKKDPSEIFEYFEEEPLGTASLAQVHKARLKKDGSLVAVKVQHSLVLDNSKADLRAMEVLVNIMSSIFEEFRFQWLVDETKLNLPKELDFTHEAKNSEKVREIFSGFKWLEIPKVNWDLTTSRVLTMEFAEGAQITDLAYIREKKINCLAISSRLGELYSHMIFKHGFVHSDPHPGNILIRQSDENKFYIVLLDHGLYASLTEEFRWNYSKFWMSILSRDQKKMKETSETLGIDKLYPILICMVTGRTWESVTGGIDKIKYSESEKDQFVNNVPALWTKIGEVLQTVNREMLLLLKTNDILRGIEHSLGVDKRLNAATLVLSDVQMLHRKYLRRTFATLPKLYGVYLHSFLQALGYF